MKVIYIIFCVIFTFWNPSILHKHIFYDFYMYFIEILWHWKFVMNFTCKKNTLLVMTSSLWNEHIIGLWFASQPFSMLLSTWTNLALQYVLFWYQNFQIQLGNFLFYYNITFQHKNSMWKHDNETSKFWNQYESFTRLS
jgi:hypothetical protein